MSLANLSRHYQRMRRERDDAVGEYQFLGELIAGYFLDKSPAALTFLTVIAEELRRAETAIHQRQAS